MQPPGNSSQTTNMNNSYANADLDAVRQAQREWRIAKRREIEAKARRKAFKQRSVNPNPASSVHASAVNLVHRSTSIPTPPTTLSHPVHFTQTQLIQHATTDPAAVAAVAHVTVSTSEPSTTVAPSAAAVVHVPSSMPAIPHTHTALSQGLSHHIDSATAAAFQAQLNSNAKRPRMVLEESTVPEDATDPVTSAGLALQQGVNATESHYGPPVSIGVSSAPLSSLGQSISQVGSAAIEPRDEAHRQLLEQLEAQRRWREAKRREIALKKAKGASSKRGRKKMRREIPGTQGMQHLGETVMTQQPMTTQGAVVGHVAVTYVPDVPGQHVMVLQQAQGGIKGEEHGMEEATAMYVETVGGGHGEEEDCGGQREQHGDVQIGDGGGDLGGGGVMQTGGGSGAFTEAELGHDDGGIVGRGGTGGLQLKGESGDLREKDGGNDATERAFRISADDALRASVEIALKAEKPMGGEEDGKDRDNENEGVEEVKEAMEESIGDATVQATEQAAAEGMEEQGAHEEGHDDGGGGGGDEGGGDGSGGGEETVGDGGAEEEMGRENAETGENEGMREDTNEDERKEVEQQERVELKSQEEVTTNTGDTKTEEAQVGFGVDGGDDLMNAAAWTSLDSIGHT